MCGIIGYVGHNNCLNMIIDGLQNLEYRGYDSAGIAYLLNNKIYIDKEKGKIENLKKKIDFNIKSNLGIGHTRWATHGAANSINSHPHNVGDITIVHNGIIENYMEIKNFLENSVTYKSETDTEVACALLNYYYNIDHNIINAISKFTKTAIGSYALGIIVNGDDKLYAVKKNSPLIIGIGKNENYIASDVPAILNYTNKYTLLDDYEIVKLEDDNITYYNQDLNEIKKEILCYDSNINSISLNGFAHFMLKEIYEQPTVFSDTIEEFNNIKNTIDLSKYNNIAIVACGSAYHAGLIGKDKIEELCNIKVDVYVASEFRYNKVFLNEKTLVIAISQSGETADTLAAVLKANENNCDTLGIINVKQSTIARNCKYVIYTNAKAEIAVATTKAYTSQITVLILLAIAYNKVNLDIEQILDEAKKLPTYMEKVLNFNYKSIATKIFNNENIFYIGRGNDYYLCLEGALKLKEVSYINCNAYPAGELKHGTISLIEDKTPVISIALNKLIDKTISNIKEVKARGSYNILITDSNDDYGFIDNIIKIPEVNDLFKPILAIIPLQLLAYHIAVLKNCDVDKPKNLAKSVTVE